MDFPGINFLDILSLTSRIIPLFKNLDGIIWGNSGARFYKILGGFKEITTLFIFKIIINFFQ